MKFLILISALTLVSGQQWLQTQVSPCTYNSGPLPVFTETSGCIVPPCTVTSGENTHFNILFRAPHDLNTLRTRAIAFLATIPIPFDLGVSGDTCSNLLSGSCPASQGALLLHRLSIFIDSTFPIITIPMEFPIEDENNKTVACFRVTLNIVRPAQKLDTPNAPMLELTGQRNK